MARGSAPQRRAIIDKGVLTTWILDLRSARQLKLKSTGHASRGTTSPPGPSVTNLYMEKGKISRADLLKGIDKGLFVTEFIGMGVNNVTGDYSRGAAGFWIENGELTFPVSEITVARQSHRDVQERDSGRRSRVPLRRRCADAARRRDDDRGVVSTLSLALSRRERAARQRAGEEASPEKAFSRGGCPSPARFARTLSPPGEG